MKRTHEYAGYEIIEDKSVVGCGRFTIIDDNGSGHTEASLSDCRETIDNWN
tara:strand:+ start:402 stop:554 length:153 start_codon:yes stop_codon:yes gene_type:complete